MTREERLAALATLGLVIGAVGTFLPWARIGGRARSGYSTADLFVGLGSGELPDIISWVGRWWYLPVILILLAWASVFLGGSRTLRVVSAFLVVLALAMWWVFVWAGGNWSVFDVRWIGPIVATVGAIVVAGAAGSKRESLLHGGTKSTS